MREHVVLHLRENLDCVKRNGMPPWVDKRQYSVRLPMPSDKRFIPGLPALVYAQRSNRQFMFVGLVRNLCLDRKHQCFTFDSFERFERPVLIEDGPDYDPALKDQVFPAEKGFLREFSYIDEGRFNEAVRQSKHYATPATRED